MKSMMKYLFIFSLIIVGFSLAKEKEATRVELKNGYYYIDGKKTFVNAIGYEIGARPGEFPKENRKSQLARMKSDFEVIKKGGFNAVRTWDPLFKDELELAQQSGMKVIMGIGMKPEWNFADQKIIARTDSLVESILSYSKNFDCIITYLVINEPMPQHIHDVGAQATVDLWKRIINKIHEKHPGVPVTMSGNTAITEYLDMNIFDVYGYNAYDYGDGAIYTHGFANANIFLQKMNGRNKPLLLTEFGYSVSRLGYGKYGGNSLDDQRDALIRYYRNLLDAGVAGVCPFYYADGWWKGGHPSVHDDTPEEWFGYWGYSDLKDTIGHPRPVWYALTTYNKALIASPRNQTFYKNEIPIELFCQNDIAKIKIVYHDKIIYEGKPNSDGYISDNISFAGDPLKDRELVFECYDKNDNLIKVETIIVLTGKDEIQWPTLDIKTGIKDLNESENIKIELSLKNGAIFTLGNEVRDAFSHHKGWEPGPQRSITIDPAKKEQTVTDSYTIPRESLILAIYAGADIRYGKFKKTIYNQKFIYRGTWADPIRVK
ncbi:MAG: hypothetical protein NTX44_00640 [Ignavibacteriales bacterium]|nr:hypothetical protein [Ignavibacteriales bacterium]